jgi:uncharacterized protein
MTAMVVSAVLAGAAAQRVTGVGFALVVAPFAVLVLGASSGIVFVNLCGGVAAAAITSRVWPGVEWPVVARLLPAMLLGVAGGTAVAAALPPGPAQVAVGSALLVSLAGSSVVGRIGTLRRTTGTLYGFGAAAGVMGAVAGASGPALSVLAVASRWDQARFAATVQPCFAATSVAAVAARVLAEPRSWPALPVPAWICLAAGMVAGTAVGDRISRRVSPSAARRGVMLLAVVGAVLAVREGAALL